MKTLLVFLLLACSIFCQFYVDPVNGNDSNPGTEALPWSTLVNVNTTIFPANTTIYLLAGADHVGPLIPISSNLTIDRYGSSMAKPRLYSLGALVHLIDINNISNITVKNLLLENGINGVLIRGSTNNITIENLTVLNCTENGIFFFINSSGNGCKVLNNEIFLCLNDGINLKGAIYRVEIAYNHIHDIGNFNDFPSSASHGDAITSHDTATFVAHHNMVNMVTKGLIVNVNTSGLSLAYDNYGTNLGKFGISQSYGGTIQSWNNIALSAEESLLNNNGLFTGLRCNLGGILISNGDIIGNLRNAGYGYCVYSDVNNPAFVMIITNGVFAAEKGNGSMIFLPSASSAPFSVIYINQSSYWWAPGGDESTVAFKVDAIPYNHTDFSVLTGLDYIAEFY